jgi:probable addiction module antidote protein
MKKTQPLDISKYLDSEEMIAAYLNAAIEEDTDGSLLASALGNIAKARGMTDLANKMKVSRSSLYKSLSDNGKPELATIIKVCRSLNLKLNISAT